MSTSRPSSSLSVSCSVNAELINKTRVDARGKFYCMYQQKNHKEE
jgi:hypothetical protein